MALIAKIDRIVSSIKKNHIVSSRKLGIKIMENNIHRNYFIAMLYEMLSSEYFTLVVSIRFDSLASCVLLVMLCCVVFFFSLCSGWHNFIKKPFISILILPVSDLIHSLILCFTNSICFNEK